MAEIPWQWLQSCPWHALWPCRTEWSRLARSPSAPPTRLLSGRKCKRSSPCPARMSIYKKTSSLPPWLFFSIRDVTAYLHTKRLKCFLLHLSNELLTQIASLGTSSSSPPIPKLTPPKAFPILVSDNFIFQSFRVKKPWNHQPLLTSQPTSIRQLYLSTISSKKFLTLNPSHTSATSLLI